MVLRRRPVRAADLLATLRNAVAEFGGDAKVERIQTVAVPDDADPSGYTATKPNPAIGASHNALLIRLGPNGTMKLEVGNKGETDAHRREMRAMYGRRNRKWREEGKDEGRSTAELAGNPNEALETQHDSD